MKLYLTSSSVGDRSVGQTGGRMAVPNAFQLPQNPVTGAVMVPIFELRLGNDKKMMFFWDREFASEEHIVPQHSTIDQFPNVITPGHIEDQHVTFSARIMNVRDCVRELDESPLKCLAITDDERDSGVEAYFGRLDGMPIWKANPEVPPVATDGSAPTFLFQIAENLSLVSVNSSLPQKRINYFSDSGFSYYGDYEFFAGNEIYFFYYNFQNAPQIFVVVQS